MRKQKATFLIMLLLLSASAKPMAKESKSGNNETWSLARKSEDISVYYRWVTIDSVKTREMRARFFIQAEVPEILAHFYDPQSYFLWAVGVKECRITKMDNSEWVTYALMSYPWPLKQKDLVTRHIVRQTASGTRISISADPQFFPKKEGVERMENYRGEWHFISAEDGTTEVDYRVVSFTKPVFPRFIQDPVIQNLFIDSFHDLKHLAETK
ncbi:SRPBCC family protein [Mariniphaga sediminis]|uniref:hypothetical protein n=1 Tax=Mariniphaga sediminis TaxID=1628158 RepID=UPI001558A7F8|nr:hypothetical protein [Mariniphaga sediminis]